MSSLTRLSNLTSLFFPPESPCFRLQRLLLSNVLSIPPDDLGEQFPVLRELCIFGLEKLSLDRVGIVTLPASILCLAALESLSITRSRLKSIPEGIGELTNLRTLVLSWCEQLQRLPEGTGRLGDLRELTLSCCSKLTALPASITQLTRLNTLKAPMCIKLASAPRALENLSCLRELDLTGCVRLKKTLESLPRSLETLSLGNDTKSITLPDLSMAPNLKKLNLIRATIMNAPTASRCLSHIQHLELRLGTEQIEPPLLLGFLSRLRSLRLSNAVSLQHLPHDIGTALPQLRQLHVEGAESLTEIPESVTRLVQLTSLHIKAPRLILIMIGRP
ncbi:unnamed protein product [Closterium sp. Yama58-4]|nr:unnamed protein product [Closterium sp. Yama58-4]